MRKDREWKDNPSYSFKMERILFRAWQKRLMFSWICMVTEEKSMKKNINTTNHKRRIMLYVVDCQARSKSITCNFITNSIADSSPGSRHSMEELQDAVPWMSALKKKDLASIEYHDAAA